MDHHEGLVGAETKAEWVRRVYRAMDQIAGDDASDKVIVTHGGSATFVIAHWIGMPIDALEYVSTTPHTSPCEPDGWVPT